MAPSLFERKEQENAVILRPSTHYQTAVNGHFVFLCVFLFSLSGPVVYAFLRATSPMFRRDTQRPLCAIDSGSVIGQQRRILRSNWPPSKSSTASSFSSSSRRFARGTPNCAKKGKPPSAPNVAVNKTRPLITGPIVQKSIDEAIGTTTLFQLCFLVIVSRSFSNMLLSAHYVQCT